MSMFHVKPSCCYVFVVLHMTETKSVIQKLRYAFILWVEGSHTSNKSYKRI